MTMLSPSPVAHLDSSCRNMGFAVYTKWCTNIPYLFYHSIVMSSHPLNKRLVWFREEASFIFKGGGHIVGCVYRRMIFR